MNACWTAISGICVEFGFDEVVLSVRGRNYTHKSRDIGAGSWIVLIPLHEDAWLRLRRNANVSTPPLLAPLADLIRDVLSAKLQEIIPADMRIIRGDAVTSTAGLVAAGSAVAR